MDFSLLASDLICNFAAKARWRWGAGVPVVFRGPVGAGGSGGPFHTQCVESAFLGTPGLKVVAPGTVADAYAKLTGVEEKTVSSRVFADSKKLTAIRAGSDITVGRYNTALGWFSENWPEGSVWPHDVPRPEEVAQ